MKKYILRSECISGWHEEKVNELSNGFAMAEFEEAFRSWPDLYLFEILDGKTRKVLVSHEIKTPRGRPKKLNDQIVRSVYEKQKLSLAELADMFKVTRGAIQACLKRTEK